MNYQLESTKEHKNYEPFLVDIEKKFQENGEIIHDARNQIKIINLDNTNLVVKSFKIPHFINQVVYAYFRKSKAYKSFHNALRLQTLDISTPSPIGYIEFYKAGLLKKSYFASEHFNYDYTMAHIRGSHPENSDDVLKAFARFSYELHEKGVSHSDYSCGNILIKEESESIHFSIVDINRMKFKSFSHNERFKSFNKLWLNEYDLSVIAKEYAKISNIDEALCLKMIILYDRNLKKRKRFKKFLKSLINLS